MPVAPKLPKNWPQDVSFLTTTCYSGSIQPDELQVASASASSLPLLKVPNGPCPDVQIRRIVDSSHPARGQNGLFAARNLNPNSFVCFYIGIVHNHTETESASNYDLSLDRELGLGVDATSMGNEARFINDYRGIQEAPNAEFRDCLAAIGGRDVERRVGVFVLSPGKRPGKRAKGISKGEEILVSYGKGFWSHRKTEDEAGPAGICSTEL